MADKWYDEPMNVVVMIVFAAACFGDDINNSSNAQTTIETQPEIETDTAIQNKAEPR